MAATWSRFSRAVVVTLGLLALLVGPPLSVVLAQSVESLPRAQVSLAPGGAAEGQLSFVYQGAGPAVGRLVVAPYPGNAEELRPPAGAASWIDFETPSLVLRPGATVATRYEVQVPIEAQAGDHAALIRLQSDQGDPLGGILLTITVPGQASPDLELLSFGPQPEQISLFGYYLPWTMPLHDGRPLLFEAHARNQGNFAANIGGEVELFDTFAQPFGRVPLSSEEALPGETVELGSAPIRPPLAGLLTARLHLEADGTTRSSDVWVLVVPWQQVLGALLLLIALRLLLGRGFSLLPARRPAARTEPLAERVGAATAPEQEQERPAEWAPVVEPAEVGPELPTEPLTRPEPATELIARGQELARAGERQSAYDLFVQAIERDPGDATAWLWRAGTAASTDEAIAALERVLELDPDNQRAQQGLEALLGSQPQQR